MATQGSATAAGILEHRPITERLHIRPGTVALALVGGAWLAGLALVLSHSVFVTNDSLSNYAHVWYASEQIWNAHSFPFHMPVLEHGEAYAFPYAFLPWVTAALLRPLFGDWIVTLWLVVGFAGVVGTTWWAFPELRGAWWTALLLANPMLVEAVLLGQLPFLWATALLFAAIAAWRRGWWLPSAVLLGAAQATHPAVILPIAGVLVLARLCWEPRRARLLAAYAVSLVIAAPAAWLVLSSPVVGDSSRVALAGNFFGTVSLRALVVAAPFIALVLQRSPGTRMPAALLVALVALNVALVPVRHDQYAWTALTRSPNTSLASYTDSAAFAPGATYRLLRVGDGKFGMYQVLRAGGSLDAEFFPESIGRQSWNDTSAYAAFLRERSVDYVIIYDAYDTRYRTDEHALLTKMASDPTSGARDGGTCVSVAQHHRQYDVYRIDRCVSVRAPS
jgi:hypothetical protein